MGKQMKIQHYYNVWPSVIYTVIAELNTVVSASNANMMRVKYWLMKEQVLPETSASSPEITDYWKYLDNK